MQCELEQIEICSIANPDRPVWPSIDCLKWAAAWRAGERRATADGVDAGARKSGELRGVSSPNNFSYRLPDPVCEFFFVTGTVKLAGNQWWFTMKLEDEERICYSTQY
ncbi:MAG TPA: hypothetical protein VM120_05880 [Bryobacteraceae bacterium]|nr:hypothetical protein [Bryobacteraceae bacterium]